MKKSISMKIVLLFLSILMLVFSTTSCNDYKFGSGILKLFGIDNFEYILDHNSKTAIITGVKDVSGTTITIPQSINGYKVVSIGDFAFAYNLDIEKVYIPNTIEHIGKGAFYKCDYLTSVIGLEKCTNLKTIEKETFFYCMSLKNISLPDGLNSINQSAFKSCYALTDINIPDSVTHIGEYAFDNCQSIEEFVVPEGVTKIEKAAFFACLNLKKITLPEGLTEIGAFAFCSCYQLTYINLPSTLKDIGSNDTFNNCTSLTDVNLPNGIKEINQTIFVQCTSLVNVTIPDSVEFISYDAFDFCSALEHISISKTNPKYKFVDGAIYDKETNTLVRYLMGKTGDRFAILNGVEFIGEVALAGNPHLKVLDIPKSVKRIDQYALYSSVIHTINYGGTVQEWESIEKDPLWDESSADYNIYCTDGQIAKDGTVTYN